MTSLMEMSLADIIKSKKRKNLGKPQQKERKNNPVKSPIKKPPMTDARNKIIMKKRVQITDAREKLSQLARQKDARLKLEQLRKNKNLQNVVQNKGRKFNIRRDRIRNVAHKEMMFTDLSRQVVSKPLTKSRIMSQRQIATKQHQAPQIRTNVNGPRPMSSSGRPTVENDDDEYQQSDDVIPSYFDRRPIVRTIANDLEIEDDPMDVEYNSRPTVPFRKTNLQFKIVAHNNDVHDPRKSTIIQRTTRDTNRLTYQQERVSSPARPPSILKKRPMAALRSERKPDVVETPTLEYRIIVSNLRSSVTGGDIEELFGDIGGMVESRLVRPGTAEVIYKTVEDAQRAVDLYHNRQLDGQPMTCLLVTPRSNAAPARSSNTPALYSTNSNVEPDLSTFHKVLFSNL